VSQPSGEVVGRPHRPSDAEAAGGVAVGSSGDAAPARRALAARRSGLLACERAVLGAVVRKGMRVLDLGAMPGSTIDALSTKALAHPGGSYRGVATGAVNLQACREAFPHLEFVEGDGTDLSSFASGAFDAVVFARNGIARLEPDDQRVACEQEIYRVLRTGGIAVLSMVNPQAVVEPPSGWRTAPPARRTWLFMGSAGEMLRSTAEGWRDGRLRTPHLYLDAPSVGGTTHYQARPKSFLFEVEAVGFRQLGPLVASDHPHPFQRFVSPWYYVAVRKV
jgi:SAM-dependent methyltransferase